jgi:hypothetical protein
MRNETDMQAVSYHCDVCGVKVPVTPKDTSAKVKDQEEFAHFVIVLNKAIIKETFLVLGDGPSHGRCRIEEPKQLDVCQGCSKLPLATIIEKAKERANAQSSG